MAIVPLQSIPFSIGTQAGPVACLTMKSRLLNQHQSHGSGSDLGKVVDTFADVLEGKMFRQPA